MRTTRAFWNGVSQCSCKFGIWNLPNKKVRKSPEQFWNGLQLRSQWSGGCCTCDSSCCHSRGPACPGSSLSPCHPWETPTWRQSQSIRIRPWLCLTNRNRKQDKVRSGLASILAGDWLFNIICSMFVNKCQHCYEFFFWGNNSSTTFLFDVLKTKLSHESHKKKVAIYICLQVCIIARSNS